MTFGQGGTGVGWGTTWMRLGASEQVGCYQGLGVLLLGLGGMLLGWGVVG